MSPVRRLIPVLAVMAATLAPAAASAQFVDPGFELQFQTPGTFGTYTNGQSFGGWNVFGDQVALLSTTYIEFNGVSGGLLTFQAHSGLNSVDLTGAGNHGLTSGVGQYVSTTIGQSYVISFWVGRATGNGFYLLPSTVDLSFDGGVTRHSFTNANVAPDVVNWQQFSYTFTATSALTSVGFYNGTDSPNNNMVGLDDVSITPTKSVVPEPASFALVATGLLGIGIVARRRTPRTA